VRLGVLHVIRIPHAKEIELLLRHVENAFAVRSMIMWLLELIVRLGRQSHRRCNGSAGQASSHRGKDNGVKELGSALRREDVGVVTRT